MNIFKKIKSKIILMRANSSYENKRSYLINNGAKIGENTRLNCKVSSFGTEPYLISVGDNCLFADEVHFITHDGGVKVISTLHKTQNDIIAPIKIDNNVYIGQGAYIMPGVHIGSNSIIGAAAVVTKDVPENSVAVGIPAKVIKTTDEYYKNALNKNKLYNTGDMNMEEKRKYFEKNNLLENYFLNK